MTPRYAGPTIEEVKTAANRRMEDVLAWCNIKQQSCAGGYIHICDPKGNDDTPSFTIWLKGGELTFKRWGSRYMGDIFGFVAYMNGWFDLPKKGLPETLRFLIDKLGLQGVDRKQLEEDTRKARAIQVEQGKRERQQAEKNAERAFALFLEGKPILGSPAEIYLREARGIDLRAFPAGPRGGDRLPGSLRFLPNHPHSESKQSFPCLLSACTDPLSGEIRAVHRTWLKPDGSGKADVTPQRKVWPGFRGLVMPLWRGETGWTVGEAIAAGLRETLVLTEGNEDGLSAALAAPQYRTWAFISLGNLQNVALPPCIDSVLLHRQSEWTNRQAVAAFEVGRASIEAQGVPVAEIKAFSGKDLNDTLRRQ